MMSGTLPDQNHPSFSRGRGYQILNDKSGDKEQRARIKEQCDKVFAKFGELRGRVIARTIAMESVLDEVLVSYYCPTISADALSGVTQIEMLGPKVARSAEFYDFILSKIALRRKIELLFETLSLAGIQKPSDLGKALEDARVTRNWFGHRLIGIDAQTGDVSLWHSKERRWEPVVADVESRHLTQCENAMALLSDVRVKIERLLASGEQYPEVLF